MSDRTKIYLLKKWLEECLLLGWNKSDLPWLADLWWKHAALRELNDAREKLADSDKYALKYSEEDGKLRAELDAARQREKELRKALRKQRDSCSCQLLVNSDGAVPCEECEEIDRLLDDLSKQGETP